MLIKTRNTLDIETPKTRLTHTEAADVGTLRWQNPNAFEKSWAVQIGETGEEQTEILLLSTDTPAGTAGTFTTNTLYEHPADTPLYAIKYDQVVFGSSSGTAVASSTITGGSVTYQADNEFTQFDDTNGDSTVFYQTQFRNSVLSTLTTASDWITSAGFDYYSLGAMRQRVKDKLWNSEYVVDSQLNDWINEYREQMINEVISVNEDYALGTLEVGFGTDGLGTLTTADFVQPRRVWITYNGVDKYQSTKMNVNDFAPNQQFSSVHPYHYWQGDDILGISPTESGGTASLVFYRLGTTMVNDTDILPTPMRGFTKGYVDYCLAQALFKDGKQQEYITKTQEANSVKDDFVNKIVPRDKTGVTMIDVVEPISGDDGWQP